MFLVFIADTGKEVFVWIGKRASEGEKKNGIAYAQVCFKSLLHYLSVLVVVYCMEVHSFDSTHTTGSTLA